MFVRVKPSGKYQYLQVVENYRAGPKVKQKVIGTLGRLDLLLESGTLDNLARSLLRFSKNLKVIDAHQRGIIKAKKVLSIGPNLVFGRLWERMGLKEIITQLLEDRKFSFSVERAIFLTVLHRLFASGSDREADKWKEDFRIGGVEELQLHHLYRAMAWLGEELSGTEQEGATAFAPRCTKDLIEERLFEQHRDLFSSLELVFFDTTTIYFEGEGGESLGARGNSKERRPDLKQMVVGVVLDGEGRPICCELWPGNTADVKTLLPIIKRLKERFSIHSICIVADRGMISNEIIQALESSTPPIKYILGVRMRKLKEVKEEVLPDGGKYREIFGERRKAKDPSPLQVKEVFVDDRRYIECFNLEQARKDIATREAILEALEEKLKIGDKSLVGNKGYRKYLRGPAKGNHFSIDKAKVEEEERFDGKWVLRTNTDLPAEEVALEYKHLWMVESIFRSVKSILKTRPVYHKYDSTIRGHVFCSFLTLVLVKELQSQIDAKKMKLEWNDILRDLEKLEEVEVEFGSLTFFLRTELRGNCVDVLRAAGVRVPSSVRR
jgi:transposase